jgi:hypothetical protein
MKQHLAFRRCMFHSFVPQLDLWRRGRRILSGSGQGAAGQRRRSSDCQSSLHSKLAADYFE